jgi:hypothetical protein
MLKDFKTFRLNDEYEIICEYNSTKSGFNHTCYLLKNNENVGKKARVSYLNRTWERYTFQSAIKKLVKDNNKILEKLNLDDKLENGNW